MIAARFDEISNDVPFAVEVVSFELATFLVDDHQVVVSRRRAAIARVIGGVIRSRHYAILYAERKREAPRFACWSADCFPVADEETQGRDVRARTWLRAAWTLPSLVRLFALEKLRASRRREHQCHCDYHATSEFHVTLFRQGCLTNRSEKLFELVELRIEVDPPRLLGAQKLCRVGLAPAQTVFDGRLLTELALQPLLLEFIPPSL